MLISRQKPPAVVARSLEESHFRDEGTLFSLKLSCRATPKVGTRLGSIVKILRLKMSTHCRVIDLPAVHTRKLTQANLHLLKKLSHRNRSQE
jgi:hypothetical protein